MRGVQLIVNPAARGGRSAETEALTAFGALGIRTTVHRTAAAGDASRLALSLVPHIAPIGDDALCVLGGDGTVMEVVGALVGRGVPVGIVPSGTGNQLARYLRIPLSVAAAARVLGGTLTSGAAAERAVPFDLGRLVDGRYFAITAGIGLDAAMIAGAKPAAKRRFGVGAYLVSAARSLRAPPRFNVRIEADGVVVEREAALAMIANVGSLMGGRFTLGPGIVPDDGWLDVCVFSPRGLGDGLALAARLARRDFRADRRMIFVRARSVSFQTEASVLAQADGELLTSPQLAATVVPAGALFLVPTR